MHFLLPYELRATCRPRRLTSEDNILVMQHAKAVETSGAFGNIISQVFKGKDYQVWQHHFTINTGIMLLAYADKPTVSLHYMLKGSLSIDLKRTEHSSLPENTAQFLYFPAIRQNVWFEQGLYHSIHVEFGGAYISRLQAFAGLKELIDCVLQKSASTLLHSTGKIGSREKMLLGQITGYYSDRRQADLEIQSKILELLLRFVRKYADERGADSLSKNDQSRMESIRAFISDNVDQIFKVSELARKFGINETSLYRKFKNQFGCSVSQFSKECRLVKAMDLVTTTDISLTDIAGLVGYDLAENFTHAFKNYFGSAPEFTGLGKQ